MQKYEIQSFKDYFKYGNILLFRKIKYVCTSFKTNFCSSVLVKVLLLVKELEAIPVKVW